MNKILFSFILAFALSTCGDNPVATDNVARGNGSSEYFPLTVGSTWNYFFFDTLGEDTFSFAWSIKADTFAFGQQCVILENRRDTSVRLGLLRRNADTVFTLQWGSGPGEIFLVERPLGSTWRIKYMSYDSTDFYNEYTLAEEGLTRTVNRRIFQDVIRVQHRRVAVKNGAETQQEMSQMYCAKGIGIIEWTSDRSSLSLRSFSVR